MPSDRNSSMQVKKICRTKQNKTRDLKDVVFFVRPRPRDCRLVLASWGWGGWEAKTMDMASDNNMEKEEGVWVGLRTKVAEKEETKTRDKKDDVQ